MSMSYISFAALRGKQGEHDYYVIQCPIRLVPRLLLYNEPEVPNNIRQGKTLNSSLVESIKQYLLTHSDDFVLAPLIVSTDAAIEFNTVEDWPLGLGVLRFPITARLFVHDGQHRRAALQQLLSTIVVDDAQTVPVMVFVDPSLTFSNALYAVLNTPRGTPTKSQRVLHNQSADLSALVRRLIEHVPLFKGLTETTKTTISNRSTALFTASAIYQATQELLGIRNGEVVTAEDAALAEEFWTQLGMVIPEYTQAIRREVATVDLRQNYVHAHGVMLTAFGKAGYVLIQTYPQDWQKHLQMLGIVDWTRSNTKLWEGRAMVLGKMSKATNNIKLATSAVKQILGLPITQEEQELEQLLLSK